MNIHKIVLWIFLLILVACFSISIGYTLLRTNEQERDNDHYEKTVNDRNRYFNSLDIDYKYLFEKATGFIIPDHVPNEHVKVMYTEGIKNKLPLKIWIKLINQESRFKANAKSHKGAEGYTQMMPDTFEPLSKKLKLDKKYRTTNNIKASAYYLKTLDRYWSKRIKDKEYKWKLILASYNAGLGNVLKYGGIPPFKETKDYIKAII